MHYALILYSRIILCSMCKKKKGLCRGIHQELLAFVSSKAVPIWWGNLKANLGSRAQVLRLMKRKHRSYEGD